MQKIRHPRWKRERKKGNSDLVRTDWRLLICMHCRTWTVLTHMIWTTKPGHSLNAFMYVLWCEKLCLFCLVIVGKLSGALVIDCDYEFDFCVHKNWIKSLDGFMTVQAHSLETTWFLSLLNLYLVTQWNTMVADAAAGTIALTSRPTASVTLSILEAQGN